MTEGLDAFRDAISNLERAAGGRGSLDPSHYEDSSMPELRQGHFTGKAGFWAWDENGDPVDAIDEISQAAYTADNPQGIGASRSAWIFWSVAWTLRSASWRGG